MVLKIFSSWVRSSVFVWLMLLMLMFSGMFVLIIVFSIGLFLSMLFLGVVEWIW